MTKKKYVILAMVIAIFSLLWYILVTYIFSLNEEIVIAWDKMFKDNEITIPLQWKSLVSYRLIIYILPALVLSFIRFDKRYKWITRYLILQNLIFGTYVFINSIIHVFALDLFKDFILKDAFNLIDSITVLSGYVLTMFIGKKIEFGGNDSYINKKSYEN